MKSKTSFFNTSLLRKDILRFAPAWGLYTAFLVLVFVGGVFNDNERYIARSLASSLQAFPFFNLGYGLLCAQLLFGDLHNSRMCNALHALPVRRESWFATHTVAGLLFAIVPVAVTGLIFILILQKLWLAALLWMAAMTLQFVLFFAIGALSMILTGNRFAAVVVYAILNFIAAIVLWLFYALYAPHLHGVVVDYEPWLVLCPVVELATKNWYLVNGVAQVTIELQDGWGYLGICTAVAVVILAGALMLYRKRPLESAGDFLSFRALQPAFLLLYTFSAGAALHLFSQLFINSSTEMVFLVAGLIIGFITGLMLLKRTVRVFRWRMALQFVVILATFGLSLLLTAIDPLGITRWTPDVEAVKCVTLDRMYNSTEMDYAITDPEMIRQVISIHQHGIDHPDAGNNGEPDTTITIRYTMKAGYSVVREYYIDTGSVAAVTTAYVRSQPENIFGAAYPTAEKLLEKVTAIRVYNKSDEKKITDKDEIRAIVEAAYIDAKAGNLCQDYRTYKDYGNSYSIEIEGGYVDKGEYGYNLYWYVHFSKNTKLFAAVEPHIP